MEMSGGWLRHTEDRCNQRTERRKDEDVDEPDKAIGDCKDAFEPIDPRGKDEEQVVGRSPECPASSLR